MSGVSAIGFGLCVLLCICFIDLVIERWQARTRDRVIENRAAMVGYSALWDGETQARQGGLYLLEHADDEPALDTMIVSPEVAERMRLLDEAIAAGDTPTVERLERETWTRLGL
jgi:hypothetical protein